MSFVIDKSVHQRLSDIQSPFHIMVHQAGQSLFDSSVRKFALGSRITVEPGTHVNLEIVSLEHTATQNYLANRQDYCKADGLGNNENDIYLTRLKEAGAKCNCIAFFAMEWLNNSGQYVS